MDAATKRRIFRVMEGLSDDPAERAFGVFISTLIALNVAAFILETVPAFAERYGRLFLAFEWASVGVFTIEYLVRVWSCTAEPRFAGGVRGRLRFAATPLALVDVLAVAPAYLVLLPAPIVVDLRVIRVLRFVRLLRLVKIGRYSESMKTLAAVLRAKREELWLALTVVAILLVLTSSFMYFAEHDAQPEAFGSIPEAMWWAIVTLTTIGYGDLIPVTPLGKLLGAVTALLGIGMVALPTAILASGFLEEIQKRRGKKQNLCPHCGNDVDAPPAAPVEVPVRR